VFYISASVYAFGTIFYSVFGSGELQPWGILPDTLRDLEIKANATREEEKENT